MKKLSWNQIARTKVAPHIAAKMRGVSVGEACAKISNINELANWPKVEVSAPSEWLVLAHNGTPAFIARRLMNCPLADAKRALSICQPYKDLPAGPRLERGLAKIAAEIHGMKFGPVEVGDAQSEIHKSEFLPRGLGVHAIKNDADQFTASKVPEPGKLTVNTWVKGRPAAMTLTDNSDAIYREPRQA
jgi:hypothetical protein